MSVTKTATDRIAALREEYARLGENVDHLSDLDLLNQELERTQVESRRHENNHSSLLQDQVKRDRSVYSAARRSAQSDVTARAGLYLQAILRRSARPINEVVHRAAELPANGKATAQQVRDLKTAADRAKWLLSGMVGDRNRLEDVAHDPDVQLVEKLNAEIRRLREFVAEQGKALHAEQESKATRENGWRCACRGCELIRAMDDVPVEHAAA